MRMKWTFSAALLFAFTHFSVAAEQVSNCRLKHGSMVSLDAAACTLEGGAVVRKVAAPVPPVTVIQLADDPVLADAQRTVAGLLMKQVMDSNPKKRMPEWIERKVKFDGCRLLVDEEMEAEYSKTFLSRKHFRISSWVDMNKIAPEAISELGKVTSYGGGMEVYAVNIEEREASEGNALSVAMQVQREEGFGKYSAMASAVFWDAPDADLRMADVYGYPKDTLESAAETGTVRLLFLMNTPEDAAALHKALGKMQTLCQP